MYGLRNITGILGRLEDPVDDAAGQGWTVDDLKAGEVERGSETLVDLRVEVATADQYATPRLIWRGLGQIQ
jgi:hypothetical protein